MDQWVLAVHAGVTCAMAGLVWFVQAVHYPLFSLVSPAGFAAYEVAHTRRTTWVVAPAMLLELAAALAIAVTGLASATLAWLGLSLLAAVWISTFALQVPRHRRLQRSFDPRTHRALVRSNWLRTAAWTSRAVLSLVFVAEA